MKVKDKLAWVLASSLLVHSSMVPSKASAQTSGGGTVTEQSVESFRQALTLLERFNELELRVKKAEQDAEASRLAITVLSAQLTDEIKVPTDADRDAVAKKIEEIKDADLAKELRSLHQQLKSRKGMKDWLNQDPQMIVGDIKKIQQSAQEVKTLLLEKN